MREGVGECEAASRMHDGYKHAQKRLGGKWVVVALGASVAAWVGGELGGWRSVAARVGGFGGRWHSVAAWVMTQCNWCPSFASCETRSAAL